MRAFSKQFSFPGALEPLYAGNGRFDSRGQRVQLRALTACGAALDNPDLIVTAVVGVVSPKQILEFNPGRCCPAHTAPEWLQDQ
jgi:hypothetical protein